MDYLWTPWRYQYMKEAAAGIEPECIFCEAAKRQDDSETLVVYRGKKTFIILSREPREINVNLDLTEEQKLLQKAVREFAESEVQPLAKELDETGRFPRETFKKADELGLTGSACAGAGGGGGV